MERAVYFDAWFHRQHNYHPSLPPRRLRMLDDLVDYRATLLVWSTLGGGSISLPYLEQEANGEIPARYRMYGFVNDREFVEECHSRGIKILGVVFECQGWEFPAELTDAEDDVLALNELRGAGRRGWLGLREFSSNRYPNLLPPFERYFPDGLRNSAGEPVHDLLDECTTRDVHGEPCHARWVEAPDREHYCFNMDRNNPVWREYLKAIIRIQLDAGVDGVHLDEAETPLTSLQDGGCFCRDCMAGFRAHLRTLPGGELPADLRGADFDSFDYARYLLERGHDFKSNREQAPLYWQYVRYQHRVTAGYFAELADYARSYAARLGRSIVVSGNFFECLPRYYPMEPNVDVVVTEMAATGYRQPAWCRYVAGFAGDKPAVTVENPYGGVGPELLPRLQHGHGFDRLRMMLYEAAALGLNMSLPYGSWMGSVIEDAFYAPHELAIEVGTFLAGNEDVYSTRTYAETAVVFSTESSLREAEALAAADAAAPGSAGAGVSPGRDERMAFWRCCNTLVDARQSFDVLMFPDGDLRSDTLVAADVARYRTLVLPGCSFLTPAQLGLLEAFVAAGGHAVVVGPFADSADPQRRAAFVARPGVAELAEPGRFGPAALHGGPQVAIEPDVDCAVCIQRVGRGAAVHLIRYDYDEPRDEVPTVAELRLRVRLPAAFRTVSVRSPAPGCSASLDACDALGDGMYVHVLTLRDVPLYSVAVLEP